MSGISGGPDRRVGGAGDDGRLLVVHAHPDDESITTGATIARYAAEGARVTLVTCTLGELGEVIPGALAHLAWQADGGLGQQRIGELAAACAALGVADHRFLGGPGRWRDSGMMGAPSNDWPGSFWRADVGEAAAELLAVVREVRPQVMVSYDARGFYGHPDHIQAHRVARRAFELAGGLVGRLYATAMPRSVMVGALAEMRRLADAGHENLSGPGGAPFRLAGSVDDLPFGVPDASVTTQVDATGYLRQKLAAMRAHATQITVRGQFYALSDNVAQPVLGREYYTLLAGAQEPDGERGSGPDWGTGRLPDREPSGRRGWESDLLAGTR